jgi:hypothetical protein
LNTPISNFQFSISNYMNTPNLNEFPVLVQKMRIAQKRYFELMAKARKYKHPDEFTAARKMLTVSKDLERQVDEAIDVMSRPSPTAPPPPPDRVRQDFFTPNVPPSIQN